MFIGTYYHSLDEKHRVAIPKSFRTELTPGSVITYGLDGCLFLFPSDSWNRLVEKLQTLPLTSKPARDFLRLLTYHASLVDADQLGRTLLPANLLELAHLTKEIVFAGALSRVEIWDKARYHTYVESLSSKAGELEEALSELGI
ncbi:MAG: Protein MraZ [Microgenomates group bacterium GW2011_GWC1_46_16]|nr:MAG: Protein MraZ [Microgenomates group bacterium GW2011_GWC1_46_16]OGD70914.1 MAG: division/cell wall cluster transcriptional repressor MraZ [Candidatus Collierbacteria bacterium RIFOXYA1_FULL_46_24]